MFRSRSVPVVCVICPTSPRLLAVTIMSPIVWRNACAIRPCMAVEAQATANETRAAVAVHESAWTVYGDDMVWCMCMYVPGCVC